MSSSEIDILKTAILNEVEGETFYRLAADNSKKPEIREAFLSLAEDEEKHQHILRDMLANISSGSEFVLDKSLLGVASPGIFKIEKATKQVDNLEMSVIGAGILMEKASMDFYRRSASTASNPQFKELCEDLAKWEMHHLDSLEKAYDSLRADWFDQQHFSAS